MWTTANQFTCVFSKPFTRGWSAAGWTVLATGGTGRTSASRVKRLKTLLATSACTNTGPLCSSLMCFFVSALQVQTQPLTYVELVSWGWCTLCTLSWTQRLCHWLETSTSYHSTLHRYHQVKNSKRAHASSRFWLFFLFLFFFFETHFGPLGQESAFSNPAVRSSRHAIPDLCPPYRGN